MTEKSENKTTPGQNKVKPAKDEISEQDLNKVSGGLNIGSQGGGSGAGKAGKAEFDKASPNLF